MPIKSRTRRRTADTEREWNFPGTNKLELSSYEAIASESGALSFNMTTDLAVVMSKQGGNMTPTAFDVLVDIGFEDEDQYDCWVNHYADYYWLEMEAIVIEAWQILGWGPAAWLGAHPAPASDDLEWAALNETEREAAIELCYLQETWDGLAITSWTTDYAEFDSNVDESMRRREVEVDAEEDFPVDDIDEELHQFQVRAGI